MLEFPLVMFHGFGYYYCFTAVECFFLRFSPSTIELVLAWIDDFGSHNGWFTLM